MQQIPGPQIGMVFLIALVFPLHGQSLVVPVVKPNASAYVLFLPLQADERKSYETIRVSVASDGTEGNDMSSDPAISADGRYVAFSSLANNLVYSDTNNMQDVFLHDQNTGETIRITLAPDGTEANGDSHTGSISADGRYVAYGSWASNMISGDTNEWYDVFVYDRLSGTNTLVSLAADGTQGNGSSGTPSISADGRYVAFGSFANNLVNGDSNGAYDIFVHDQQTGETTRVSVATDGGQGDEYSVFPSISADGRYVAFSSKATTLVADDTNEYVDVFVHDRQTGETVRVSVTSDGAQVYDDSYPPSISADGRYVAFTSLAERLGIDVNTFLDVFVHDLQTGKTSQVSVASYGSPGNSRSYRPAISADGRYVAFSSSSRNLVLW